MDQRMLLLNKNKISFFDLFISKKRKQHLFALAWILRQKILAFKEKGKIIWMDTDNQNLDEY